MKNKYRYAFAVALALWANLAGAQQKQLHLKEALELGMTNSKQLKLSKAKIDEAAAAARIAEEKKLPEVSVTGSYLRLTNADVNLQTKNPNSGASGESPKMSQAMYGILNAALPIYAGGRIRYGIESARFLQKAAELDATTDKEEVMENLVEAYINLYKAREAVNLVTQNLGEARLRLKDLQNLEKNGLLARNDLMKAELQASQTELALLDAENNYQLASVNMNLMLGLPAATVLVPDSNLSVTANPVKPLDDYLQAAYKNRSDLAALDLRREAARTGVKAVKGERYPSLQLSAGYVAADIPKVVTITNAANIGVGVSYSISSLWKNKTKVQEAEARVNQLSANEEILHDAIQLQVNRAYLNWLSSQKKIEVYSKAIDQAAENFRIVNNKYRNNLATTTDLLEADLAQLKARMDYAFAKADAVLVYQQLLKASGQSLNQ